MIFYVVDDDEKEIMVCMFEFAKDLINLQLTETELALICAVVLIDHCKYSFVIINMFITCVTRSNFAHIFEKYEISIEHM